MNYLLFAEQVQAFENVNYKSKSTAALEIIVMLAGAFVLGYLLHWLICRARHGKSSVRTERPAAVRPRQTSPLTETKSPDDLTIIEGIGPKIEEVLNSAGIKTYTKLATTPASELKNILNKAGGRYHIHDPGTWPRQAALARDGKMSELEELKSQLTGGR